MLPDPWLKRWLPLILQSAAANPVLEIGCGTGDDTATLAAAGLAVMAFDISPASVAIAKLRVPGAVIECRDTRDAFPVSEGRAGSVVASLTLHYFPWIETVRLIDRIRSTLRRDGIFLCRLNSTEDKNFGASGNLAIEANYYLVNGQPKRFFDEASVDELFAAGWQILSKEHVVTRKYIQQKALWEVVLRPVDASPDTATDSLRQRLDLFVGCSKDESCSMK